MKAKNTTRLDLEKPRTKLQAVIPLMTPYVLLVDPSSACNLKCRFCPTGDKKLIRSTGRYQGIMNLDHFKKLIDDAISFESNIRVLRLYKEGEPLVNPYFAEFVKYAKRTCKFSRIDTTTNGVLLTPKLSEQIVDSGIQQINISVNGLSDDQFHFLTGTKVNFKNYVDNIKYLYEIRGDCEVYVKCIGENLSQDEQKAFFDVFGNIADRIFIEHLQPNWPGFEFNYINVKYKTGHYGQPLIENDVCPYIFYMIVVNSDLSVSLCVQDWAHRLIVGNALDESIVEIWQNTNINSYRIAHLQKRRNQLDVCKICPVLKHGLLDSIDEHTDLILKNMRSHYKALS